VDGVCEPCALLGAANVSAGSAALAASAASAVPNAQLLVRKTAHAGVTVAIASIIARTEHEPTTHDTEKQDLP